MGKIISPKRSGELYNFTQNVCNVRMFARLIVESMQIGSSHVTNIADCIINHVLRTSQRLPFPTVVARDQSIFEYPILTLLNKYSIFAGYKFCKFLVKFHYEHCVKITLTAVLVTIMMQIVY